MSPASSADRVDVSPRADDVSPRSTASPKNVAFELLIVDSPQYRARLPMRVQIYPHDTTDSIVTTVKNFYGLYSGPTGSKGVSFEDSDGNTLIARYENFSNNMRVYVRVFEEYPAEPVAYGAHNHHQAYAASAPPGAGGHQPFGPADAYNGHSPPAHGSLQSPPQVPRPLSRNERHRSRSPGGYSSDEGASSARLKDHLGNTDISVENIVEGGRRKRAKFESSVRCLVVA